MKQIRKFTVYLYSLIKFDMFMISNILLLSLPIYNFFFILYIPFAWCHLYYIRIPRFLYNLKIFFQFKLHDSFLVKLTSKLFSLHYLSFKNKKIMKKKNLHYFTPIYYYVFRLLKKYFYFFSHSSSEFIINKRKQ